MFLPVAPWTSEQIEQGWLGKLYTISAGLVWYIFQELTAGSGTSKINLMSKTKSFSEKFIIGFHLSFFWKWLMHQETNMFRGFHFDHTQTQSQTS